MNASENLQQSDLSDPGSVVRALYESISFSQGKAPDFGRVRSLFFEGARFVLPHMPGVDGVYSRTVDEWIADFNSNLERHPSMGFVETEIVSEVEVFREIAHVFSSYESRTAQADPEPFMRGLNSFQMVRQRNRWWIVNVLWDVESADVRLPDRFTKG